MSLSQFGKGSAQGIIIKCISSYLFIFTKDYIEIHLTIKFFYTVKRFSCYQDIDNECFQQCSWRQAALFRIPGNHLIDGVSEFNFTAKGCNQWSSAST